MCSTSRMTAAQPVRIIGSYLSPYVRKVLVTLHLKGVPYVIDPIVAFLADDRFSVLSPLRRIPVFVDDRVTLCDSSVICQYLEDRYPTPALFPQDIALRAQARWLEEFADTRMGEVIIWKLFNQFAIEPFVFGGKTDDAVVARAIDTDIPHILTYLEGVVPADGYVFGELSIADISIAAFFRNAMFARYRIDATRFPRTESLVSRVLALDCFAKLEPFERASSKNPVPRHREVLAALGAPITDETYLTDTARRGIMKI